MVVLLQICYSYADAKNDLHEISKWCGDNKMVTNSENNRDCANHNSKKVTRSSRVQMPHVTITKYSTIKIN